MNNTTTSNLTTRLQGSVSYGGFQASTDIPLLTIGLLSLLTNVFVIRVIVSQRTLRTSSNMILVSLGISDLMAGLVTAPLTVTCSVLLHHGTCFATVIFTKLISISTIVHISIITIDWHMFIIHALRYYEIVRKRYVLMVLVGSWFINTLVATIRLSWVLKTLDDDLYLWLERRYHFFCLGLFCVLLLVNITLDCHMLVVLHKQVNKIIKHNLTRECLEHENRMRANKRRAVIMCVIMLVTNVILWLPYFSYDLLQQAGTVSSAVEYIIIYTRILSSLFNPLIYSVGQRTLRKALQARLRLIFHCKSPRSYETEEIPLN